MDCFKYIDENKPKWEFKITKNDFETAESVIFDLRNKFVAIMSPISIVFF